MHSMMDFKATFLFLIAITAHIVFSSAQNVCSSENRENPDGLDACLQAIRDTTVDVDAFWFGTDYAVLCPVPVPSFECQNPDPRPSSMADRLFLPGTFEAATIENYMDVTIHEIPGSYKGCGHTVVSDVKADHILDPVNPTALRPWQAAHSFSAAVEDLDPNYQYTLVVQDAGLFFIHGVYINIPGDAFDIKNGQVIDPYSGPLYYKNEPQNPYIFMLFRQGAPDMELTPSWESYFNSVHTDRFVVSNFAADQNLEGPIAVNWLMSLTDLYAAGRITGFVNICPFFVTEAARELDLYHVPDDVPFSVSVNVDFYSVGMEFSTCCNDYSFENKTYKLDPIGDGKLSPFDSRQKPSTVTFVKIPPVGFTGEYYTLMMIDPDIVGNNPVGTKEKPLCHWLVTNIPDGMVESGETLLSYRGPFPPAGQTHRYQFLLYQQQDLLDVNPKDYAPECVVPGISDRCLFEVERFASENELTFVGASWFKATSDGYVAFAKQYQGEEAEDVCRFIPGYGNPCPGDKPQKQRKNGGRPLPPRPEKQRKRFPM